METINWQERANMVEQERQILWQALERYRGQLDREGDMSAGRVLLLLSGDMDKDSEAVL